MATEFYKFEFYVPKTHLEEVKKAMFAAGAGRIGNYDCCAWECVGTGQFRPLEGSEPFAGQTNVIEKDTEYKVELVCAPECLEAVVAALLEAHPYETPAYQYWKVNA